MKKRVVVSLCGGITLFALCIAITALASKQFLAEGPDTAAAVTLSYSWCWPVYLARSLGWPDFGWGFALSVLANSVAIFPTTRAVDGRTKKGDGHEVRP